TALGMAQDRAAIPELLVAAKNSETQRDAILALAKMHDVRAIDAYLDGLSGHDAGVRDQCRKAIATISAEALPAIEGKLGSYPISQNAISELQKIYSKVQPITGWQLLGPFATPVSPDPIPVGKTPTSGDFKGVDGKPIHWTAHATRLSHGMVDLYSLF